MGINGGRSRKGEEEQGYVRLNITIQPSLLERLEKFQKDEERENRSWCVQKALDEWLKRKGY